MPRTKKVLEEVIEEKVEVAVPTVQSELEVLKATRATLEKYGINRVSQLDQMIENLSK